MTSTEIAQNMTGSEALTADIADVDMAGRELPRRGARIVAGRLVAWNSARAQSWLLDVQVFWLDAAAGYLALGNAEANDDAAIALAKAMRIGRATGVAGRSAA